MDLKEVNKNLKATVQLQVYEGEIEYDNNGKIKSKPVSIITHEDLPVEEIESGNL